ncbi:Uncharacterised protein [Mycobacteroides abscessus subsp. abscessus]|nr:Uncharacterised protein [Mycobacteroides abscessus subsp. abscessus]
MSFSARISSSSTNGDTGRKSDIRSVPFLAACGVCSLVTCRVNVTCSVYVKVRMGPWFR